MPQAPAYTRTKNFPDNSGDRTDHVALNAELDRVSTSIEGLRENQALIQNDDGALAYKSVGFNQLTDAAKEGLATPGPQGEKGDQGIQGVQGVQGIQGEKGNVGASFLADAMGSLLGRTAYDARPQHFSYLAIDVGQLYWKLSATSGDWSNGVTFGKGEKGDQGIQGVQGIQGIQGFRGANGIQGLKGDPGVQGLPGVVDYSRVLRNDTANAQTLQGGLTAASFATAQSTTAKTFVFYGQDARMQVTGGRVAFTDDQSSPAPKGVRVADVVSSGTGAQITGYKLANGNDIGTLFDPSGAADSKLATVDANPVVVDIAGKTTITLALQVIGSEIKLVASTS